jgi:lycopene cyclase domain-containing protein
MTGWEYLAALVVSMAAIVTVDARWKLFLWAHPRRALAVLACGIVLFVLWDSAGILSGVFERGDSTAMSGIELAPDFPLEELFFITFLCHLTMVLFTLAHRLVGIRRSGVGRQGDT